jgi:hypothetical protein
VRLTPPLDQEPTQEDFMKQAAQDAVSSSTVLMRAYPDVPVFVNIDRKDTVVQY